MEIMILFAIGMADYGGQLICHGVDNLNSNKLKWYHGDPMDKIRPINQWHI